MIYRSLLLILLTACLAHAADPSPITALCFSTDGKFLIAGSQSGIQILRWPSLQPERSIPTSLKHVHDIRVVDDTLIAAGGTPSEVGELEILSWSDGSLLSRYSDGDDVFYSIATNGKLLAVASGDHRVRLLSLESTTLIHELDRHSRRVLSVEFLPPIDADSRVVSAGSDHTIRVWNAATGEPIRSLDNHTDIVRDLALRPSSEEGLPMLASASADLTVRLWQPTIGRLVRFVKLPSEPLGITWVVGAKLLAVACADGNLRIIDADNVSIIQTIAAIDGWAYSVAAHPATQEVAIGGTGGQIRRLVIE